MRLSIPQSTVWVISFATGQGRDFRMVEERYNNRQVEKMFTDQSNDLKEHFDLKIEPLTTQVTKTNGTVRWLTKMIYVALGALPLLSIWAWIITQQFLSSQTELSPAQVNEMKVILQPIVDSGVDKAFKNNTQ